MKLDEIQEPKDQKEKAGPQDYQLFLDMDGVLVDFGKGAAKVMGIDPKDFPKGNAPKNREFDKKLWKSIREYEKAGNQFWTDLEPMPDFKELWDYAKVHNPEVLTATGDIKAADGEKREWCAKYLGKDVKVNVVDHSEHKGKFAIDNGVLIDDRQRSIDSWVAAGGIGVLHKNAKDTIKQLEELGI